MGRQGTRDIEAPGLGHYFREHVETMPADVLDFIDDCEHGHPRSWDAYTTAVDLPGAAGRLEIMPAVSDGADYAARVQKLDWGMLFGERNFGMLLEGLRSAWIQEFDLVLVDSRTGLTDFSGLTTVQLPDILAFMFTANNQSLEGCADIARRAMEARSKLPVDRPALLPLPIPGRFELREEYDRARTWRTRFVSELRPFFETWTPVKTDYAKLINVLSIPYVPRWTFGEDLAALLEPPGTSGTRSPSQSASYALETLAALLVHKLARVDLLTSSRDEFVHAARSLAGSRRPVSLKKYGIFFSYSSAAAPVTLDDRRLERLRPKLGYPQADLAGLGLHLRS
jgi:hypothetical protein